MIFLRIYWGYFKFFLNSGYSKPTSRFKILKRKILMESQLLKKDKLKIKGLSMQPTYVYLVTDIQNKIVQ